MGSANGRHRRPRQAPAIVVAAGVTGSAIAIPLLGAGAAQAADATTWDRVAECESGGTWSADFGNGSYGGLQLSPETWKAYGGESYAPRADLASRAQQIAVAEKILDARGPKAWPSCAVISGLATGGALPGVDPGVTPSADPAQSAGATGSEQPAKGASASPSDGATPADDAKEPKGGTEPSANPSATESASPSADASRSPGANDASGSSGPGSSGSSDPSGSSAPSGTDGAAGTGGKHRGAPAAEEGRDSSGGDDRESGRHASRGEGGARDTGAPVADDTYTVRPGDNLWAIADAQKVPGGWTALYESNKDVVGSDPDLILPGQNLELDVRAG
ncbi:transglycosylase family protein [Streptomyces sp. NPDC014734]|uniref:transglycosylase family protein n=1 Tax=Streptomyces sp. NPDC014734 TaxID=3364886 RepID=UPI0036FEBF63